MKSVNYLIVEVDEAYKNEVDSSIGKVIINSTIETVAAINRMATVLHAPDFTILQEGDGVIIHHNITRLRNDPRGNQVPSNFHIEGNKYFVPLTEVFMYKRGDSDWIAITPYCFVKPIKHVDNESLIKSSEDTFKGRTHLRGTMEHLNPELSSNGVKNGDTVIFSPHSEYEFEIGGEILYKMSTKDILAVL